MFVSFLLEQLFVGDEVLRVTMSSEDEDAQTSLAHAWRGGGAKDWPANPGCPAKPECADGGQLGPGV